VLDDWAEFIADSPADMVLVTTQLTTQDHGWGQKGGNAKSALASGLIEADVAVPAELPAPVQVEWRDGSTSTVELLSAADALDAIRQEGDGDCGGCSPVHVTKVRLTTHQFDTTRGPTDLPSWEFTLREGDVHVYRVAVAHALVIFRGDAAPEVESLSTTTSSHTLTVKVLGGACGRPPDYPDGHPSGLHAYAVESDTAVVVFVLADPRPTPAPDATPVFCAGVGVFWTFTIELDRPLGPRTVLDISGTPASRDLSWLTP
jgi:hypothetical protein